MSLPENLTDLVHLVAFTSTPEPVPHSLIVGETETHNAPFEQLLHDAPRSSIWSVEFGENSWFVQLK